MQLKKGLVTLIVASLPATTVFAIGGLGLHIPYDMISIKGTVDSKLGGLVTMERQGFDNPFGFGGYVYIDALPFIDLEADFQLAGKKYDFQFKNALAELDPVPFAWGRASTYVTARRKIFGLGLPLLGGVKLHAGGGLNWHNSTPFADIDMVKELLGGDLEKSFTASDLEEKLGDYLEDNKVSASGIHFQAGLQFKLMMLDAWVHYRYTLAKDVYAGQDSFGGLFFRAGVGF